MSRRRSETGFTLIELMLVLTILSLLARIAIPAYASFEGQAIAARAANDFNVIRAAAVAQFVATGSYAADAPSGSTPAGMAPYLPKAFSFRQRDYELDWEHFSVEDPGEIMAVTVTVRDPRVGLHVLRTLGANCTHWSAGDSHTFVIVSTLEAGR